MGVNKDKRDINGFSKSDIAAITIHCYCAVDCLRKGLPYSFTICGAEYRFQPTYIFERETLGNYTEQRTQAEYVVNQFYNNITHKFLHGVFKTEREYDSWCKGNHLIPIKDWRKRA